MKALVFTGDLWHSARTIRECLEGIDEFDWIEDGNEWGAYRLEGCSLVILAKANHTRSDDLTPWMSETEAMELESWVKDGGGLLVVHSGLSGYSDVNAMRRLPAGTFLHHPEPCDVGLEVVVGHELCEGVENFTCVDEHYFVELDDPEAEIFLYSYSSHGNQPAGWRRRVDEGRVCVLTPGHDDGVWRDGSFRRLLLNAIVWCRGRKN